MLPLRGLRTNDTAGPARVQRPLWNPLRDSRMPPAVCNEDTDIYGSNKLTTEVYSPLRLRGLSANGSRRSLKP